MFVHLFINTIKYKQKKRDTFKSGVESIPTYKSYKWEIHSVIHSFITVSPLLEVGKKEFALKVPFVV